MVVWEVKFMRMVTCNCTCRCNCTLGAIIAALIVGVLAAFFQITAAITVTTAFLWVVLGIAVVYLATLVIASALSRRSDSGICRCSALNTLLAGILGTILFAVVLLGFGIVATSVVSAILVGLLLGFFALTVTATACYVRAAADCGE